MKKAAAVLAILMACLGAPSVASEPASPGRPKTFRAEGHVYGLMLPPVTWYEFGLASCPSMPVTQGLTSYVIELPPSFAGGTPAVVDVVVDSPQNLTGGLGVAYFTSACESNGTGVTPLSLEPGTRYVLVHDLFRANFDFKLIVKQIRGRADVATEVDEETAIPEPRPGPVKSWKHRGHITGGGPAGLTQLEFAATCPEMPSTQGLSDEIVAVPRYLWGQERLVVAADGGGEAPAGLDTGLGYQFFSPTCEPTTYADNTAYLPPDTAFIAVHAYTRANIDYTLEIYQLTK